MIGKKLLELRKNKKMSQEVLSKMMGVTRQTISNWELEETAPDLKQAQKLADIFDVSLDELIGRKNLIAERIDNTWNNSKVIIRLIKILGVTLGLLLFILLFIVCIYLYTENYYEASPTASGMGKICYYNGKICDYIVMENTKDKSLAYIVEDNDVANELNLYNKINGDPKEILNEIVTYIENNGGICMKEK